MMYTVRKSVIIFIIFFNYLKLNRLFFYENEIIFTLSTVIKMKKTKSILGAIILVALVCYSCGDSAEKQAADNLKEIHHQVALDAEKQYEIARKSGTEVDAYVHAGLVAASYLQANDEVNYKKWKAIEKKEGVRAGMPE